MTLVVTDGRSLCVDKAFYSYGVKTNDCGNKVHEIETTRERILATGAGYTNDIINTINFVFGVIKEHQKGGDSTAFKHIFDASYVRSQFMEQCPYADDRIIVFAVVNKHNGGVSFYSLTDRPVLVQELAPMAWGHQTAATLALGALYAGADAERAIEIALHRTGTGDKYLVDTYKL